MIEPNFEKIPKKLMHLDQWVVWQKKPREGNKDQKIPFNPKNGKLASVTDPDTWGSFKEAKKMYGNGNYNGIGFVLTNKDNIVGIDLDKCFVNDKLLPEYEELINILGTYTEISPSGKGIRCFIRADADFTGFRNGNYEIYNCDRYLSVTGNLYKGINKLIRFRNDELKFALKQYFNPTKENGFDLMDYDIEIDLKYDEIIQLANNKFVYDKHKLYKFKRLFSEGDYKKLGYESPSEGVIGLCYLLAIVFNGNFNKIKNAFYQSKMMKEKWQRNKILDQTINKAILFYNRLNKTSNNYLNNWEDINAEEYFGSGSMSIDEIIKSDIKPQQFIMRPWLKKPSISYIFGGPEVGKTIFALSLLTHITRGLSFGPWEVVEPVKSLYYDVEMTKEDSKFYVSAMAHWGPELKELIIFSSAFAQENNFYISQNIFDPNWQKSIERYLIAKNIKLWVIDNIFMGTDDSSLNDSSTWATFNQWLMKLRNLGISTILLDHSGKTNQTIYGSTRKMVPVDAIIKLENYSKNGFKMQNRSKLHLPNQE